MQKSPNSKFLYTTLSPLILHEIVNWKLDIDAETKETDYVGGGKNLGRITLFLK